MSQKLLDVISLPNINTLYVTQINRISRNIKAITPIRENLDYVFVTSENRLYDVKTEWNCILNGLIIAEKQRQDIIESHKKDYDNKRKGFLGDNFRMEFNSAKNKRKRYDLYYIFNNYDYEKLAKFVCACRRIETKTQLRKLAIYHRKMYPESDFYSVYENNKFPIHLIKKDVKFYIKQATPDIEDVFINDFYNAHNEYEKKFKDFELEKELNSLSI